MKEYRKIKSLKFLYEINEEGTIRNVKSKKIVHGYVEKNGYVRVRFENKCLGGVVRTTIHRLVAEAFIPNPDNLPEVNHIDSNRRNNHTFTIPEIRVLVIHCLEQFHFSKFHNPTSFLLSG